MTMDYEERSEFERLKHADVEQGRRIAELTEQLTQARLDLFNSDAIRHELAGLNSTTAGHVVHALELLEAAFHAGADYRTQPLARGYTKSIDQAFRDWFKECG